MVISVGLEQVTAGEAEEELAVLGDERSRPVLDDAAGQDPEKVHVVAHLPGSVPIPRDRVAFLGRRHLVEHRPQVLLDSRCHQVAAPALRIEDLDRHLVDGRAGNRLDRLHDFPVAGGRVVLRPVAEAGEQLRIDPDPDLEDLGLGLVMELDRPHVAVAADRERAPPGVQKFELDSGDVGVLVVRHKDTWSVSDSSF